MSLPPPRRIFSRRRRFSALRSLVLLLLGGSSAGAIALISGIWPTAAQVTETPLPAVADMAPLRHIDPGVRVAAAVLPHEPPPGQDGSHMGAKAAP